MARRFGVGLGFWLALGTMARGADVEDATVVFYSHGSMLKSGLPGSHHGVFYGCVFDGNERLACFYDGILIKNDRYVVFHLPPGSHTFSASYSGKHAANNSQTPLQLEAGKQYFLRAQSESRGVIEIEWERGRLDEVSCEIARQELATAQPVKIKHVSQGATNRLASPQMVPPCS